MVSRTPPEQRSMSDEALNAKVSELSSQPDGLVAAMALIEDQNRIRQEDALAVSQWQTQIQLLIATEALTPAAEPAQAPLQETVALSPVEQFVVQAAPTSSPVEPQIDIFASVQEKTPLSPEPVPAPETPLAAASEKIEDIVSALSASYAEAATEEQVEPRVEVVSAIIVEDGIAVETTDRSFIEEPASSSALAQLGLTADSPNESTTSQERILIAEFSKATQRPSALVWSLLAIGSTPLVFVFAAFLKESGASLAQSLILLASALTVTSVLVGIGAVASKRGSSALAVVSRAAFGVWGNIVPGLLMFAVKIIWTVAVVFFASRIISPLVSNQPWFSGLANQFTVPAELTALALVSAVILIIASLISGFGGVTIHRSAQLSAAVSIIGLLAIGYFVFSEYSIQDLETGELLGVASLVDLGLLAFALFGLMAFSQSGDFARKLPEDTPGSKVFFLAFVSSFFLPLAAGILGLLWLFMAGDTLGSVFTEDTLATVAKAAPIWVFVLFAVAIGVSLLQLVSNSIYSLSGSLIGLGLSIPSWLASSLFGSVALAGVFTLGYLIPLSNLIALTFESIVLVAVIAAAWSGIVIADALARSRGYHEVSLTREYGFYGRINSANLIGFLLSIGLGFGYLNGTGSISSWAGYLGDLTPDIYLVAGSNIGIAMAFASAILFPVIFGIPKIKKQEKNLLELDLRRQELKEFLDAAE